MPGGIAEESVKCLKPLRKAWLINSGFEARIVSLRESRYSDRKLKYPDKVTCKGATNTSMRGIYATEPKE
jgi:hypothetical protein